MDNKIKETPDEEVSERKLVTNSLPKDKPFVKFERDGVDNSDFWIRQHDGGHYE